MSMFPVTADHWSIKPDQKRNSSDPEQTKAFINLAMKTRVELSLVYKNHDKWAEVVEQAKSAFLWTWCHLPPSLHCYEGSLLLAMDLLSTILSVKPMQVPKVRVIAGMVRTEFIQCVPLTDQVKEEFGVCQLMLAYLSTMKCAPFMSFTWKSFFDTWFEKWAMHVTMCPNNARLQIGAFALDYRPRENDTEEA